MKSWLRFVRRPGWLAFEHGQRVTVLEGADAEFLVPEILPLLDGTRTVTEVVAALQPSARTRARAAIRLLDDAGLLLHEAPLSDVVPARRETAHFLAEKSPRDVLAALGKREIAVLGGSGTARVFAELARPLVAKVDAGGWEAPPRADLTVVAPSPLELDRLLTWNDLALRDSRGWLLALPWNGLYATVGPLLVPGETCCYLCLQLRRRSNLEYAREFPHLESTGAPFPQPPLLAHTLGGLLALTAFRWLVQPEHSPPGAMAVLTAEASPSLTEHVVHRVARCPSCGCARPSPAPWFESVAHDG